MILTRNQAIASANVFIPSLNLDTIIRILNLKHENDWMKWFDDEGNLLRIKKNKTVQIFNIGNLSDTTTDIFIKAPPELISKHSYWLFQVVGKCKCISSFLGNDGRLRSCYFENGKWKNNIQPLLLGIDSLASISKNYLETEYQEIEGVDIKFINDFEVEKVFCSGEVELYKEN